MRVLFTTSLLLALLQSATPPAAASPQEVVRERFTYVRGVPRAEEAEAWASLPYTSLTWERKNESWGTCDRVRFVRGGLAIRTTSEDGDEQEYRGRVDLVDYARICHLVQRLDFAAMERAYDDADADDADTVSVTVEDRDGTFHGVSVYAEGGPVEHWALATLLEHLAERVPSAPR